MKYMFNELGWFDTDREYLDGFELIDLSKSIQQHSEVPGEAGYSDPDVLFDVKPWVDFDIKPYYITKIVMGAHTGTHVDAPMHAKEDGESIDKIPNEFIGSAVIIDANEKLNDQKMHDKLAKLNENSIVVIRGKSDYCISDDYRMQIIRSKPRIVVFGDCVNVDGVKDTELYLNSEIPMVMGADQASLDKLSDGDVIFVLPLKFVGIEAAPVRLFALRLCKSNKCSIVSYDFGVEDDE